MGVFKKVFGGAICLLLVAAISCIMHVACSHYNIPDRGYDGPDSVYIANAIENAVNPSFSTVQDMMSYQQKVIYDYSTDEIFRTMPEDVLMNVCSVCLKKYNTIEKIDVVREYKAGQNIYDNLPKSSNIDDRATEDSVIEKKPTSNVSYRYEVDTVDGKPVYTKVKEERTHEE